MAAEGAANDVLPPVVQITDAIARRFGFRNRLAMRRWCHSRNVAVREDGQRRWVVTADVTRAVLALGAAVEPVPPSSDPTPAVADILAAVNAPTRRAG